MNIVTYTAITDGKDKHRDGIINFGQYNKFKDPRLNAKIYKILPHLFLPIETEWSVWVDGNVHLNVDVRELVNSVKNDNKNIGVFKHTERSCLYDEANICKLAHLDDPSVIDKQVNRYKEYCYPEQNGLFMCFLIVRRHTEYIRRKCEQWWGEITSGSVRDQISFPFVFQNSTRIHVFKEGTVHGKCWAYTRVAHTF